VKVSVTFHSQGASGLLIQRAQTRVMGSEGRVCQFLRLRFLILGELSRSKN